MKAQSKSLALLLVATLVCSMASLLAPMASCADPPAPTYPPNIPVPAFPQYTLSYVDHSYDVPTTTSSTQDPYTGEVTTQTHPGYHVKNFTIDVTIKNQPYPSTINNGNASVLQYGIQKKGYYQTDDYFLSGGTRVDTSSSEYTVVSFPADQFTAGGTVVFRVKAILGFYYNYYYGLAPMTGFASEESDWNEQSITLTDSSLTPSQTVPVTQPTSTSAESPTPNSTITFPSLDVTSILTVAVIILVLVVVTLAVALYKKQKTQSSSQIHV